MTDCALASRRRRTCSGIASVVAAAIVMASVGWTQQSGAKAARRTQNAFIESQKPVVFEADILPMLQSRCLSCHSQSQALGGVVLESVEAIRSGRGGKRIVVAGNSDASPLFQVAARRRQPFMPPAGNGAVRLTPQELSLLKQWIDQGALTNPGTKASDRFAWQNLPATVTPVYSVAITRDGAFAACGRANQLWIYHLASGRVVARLVDPSLRLVNPEPGAAHRDLVNSLDFSPDGHLLVSGGFRTVKFWRRQTTKPTLETDSTGERRIHCLFGFWRGPLETSMMWQRWPDGLLPWISVPTARCWLPEVESRQGAGNSRSGVCPQECWRRKS